MQLRNCLRSARRPRPRVLCGRTPFCDACFHSSLFHFVRCSFIQSGMMRALFFLALMSASAAFDDAMTPYEAITHPHGRGLRACYSGNSNGCQDCECECGNNCGSGTKTVAVGCSAEKSRRGMCCCPKVGLGRGELIWLIIGMILLIGFSVCIAARHWDRVGRSASRALGWPRAFHVMICRTVHSLCAAANAAAKARNRRTAPMRAAKARNRALTACGLTRHLQQAGVGDDEQVLERAAAWVRANKPGSVEDIIRFGMAQGFVNSLNLPPIPQQKLLATFGGRPQHEMPVEVQAMPVSMPVATEAVAMGTAVGMETEQGGGGSWFSGSAGGSSASSSSSNQPTLSEAVAILKRELGLEGNVADVVKQAAFQLGVDGSLPLVEMARQCVQNLGVEGECA